MYLEVPGTQDDLKFKQPPSSAFILPHLKLNQKRKQIVITAKYIWRPTIQAHPWVIRLLQFTIRDIHVNSPNDKIEKVANTKLCAYINIKQTQRRQWTSEGR